MQIWIIGVLAASMIVNTLNGAAINHKFKRAHAKNKRALDAQKYNHHIKIPTDAVILDSFICAKKDLPTQCYWVCKVEQSDNIKYYAYNIETCKHKKNIKHIDIPEQRTLLQQASPNQQFELVEEEGIFILRNVVTNQLVYSSTNIKSSFFSTDSKFWVCLEDDPEQVNPDELYPNLSDIRHRYYLKIKLFDLSSENQVFEDECGWVNVVEPKFNITSNKIAYLKKEKERAFDEVIIVNVDDVQTKLRLLAPYFAPCNVMAFTFYNDNPEICVITYHPIIKKLVSSFFSL